MELSAKAELVEMLEALGEPVPELAQEPAPVEWVLQELEMGFGAASAKQYIT